MRLYFEVRHMGFLETVGAIIIALFVFRLLDLGLGILWGWMFD
jgi:hypothetical protein